MGKPLPSSAEAEESLGILSAIPFLGLDALSSAAYGPEAALTILLPAGLSGIAALPVLIGTIAVLLSIVGFSYWQTIGAYPNGGGSYTVARENLGDRAGLLGASALALDYILNVAVGISAGVGAVISALPALGQERLPLCLGILALLAFVNLRGIGTSGRVFALPTWIFIACLLATIGIAAAKGIAAGGAPTPQAPLPRPDGGGAIGLWLLLRAFGGGCTAVTGVEAVSNAVPVFRHPREVRARRTLVAIVSILIVLLVGIALACRAYRIAATPPGGAGYQSVLSEMVGAVVGRNWFYFVTMASIVSVLCLSANTSFAAFPRLCRMLAADRFLPPRFGHRGPRLVYVPGIVSLTVLAGILLVGFNGLTDRLIPLFAIGAFLAFTLSQLGMVFHWRRVGPKARRSLAINAVGCALTAVTVVIVLVSKFIEGAWITVVAIPATMALFRAVRRGSDRLAGARAGAEPLQIDGAQPPVVLVPLHRLDRPSRRALSFAFTISPDIQALQLLTEADDEARDLAERWPALVEAPASAAGKQPPRLSVIRAKYRDLEGPVIEHVRRLATLHHGRAVAVLLPELVNRRWRASLLRGRRAARLRRALLRSGAHGVVVIDAPWFVDG
jgi:amino acid transporter